MRVPSRCSVQALDSMEALKSRGMSDHPNVKGVNVNRDRLTSSLCPRSFREFADSEAAVPRAVAWLKGKLPQDFSHVHTADELDVFMHQVQEDGFAFRTDRREAPQVYNQFAGSQIYSGRLIGAGEFSSPRCDEFALNDHATIMRALDNRDLQHAAGVLKARERNPGSKALASETACLSAQSAGPSLERRECQNGFDSPSPLDWVSRIIARIDAELLHPGQ